MIIFFDDHSLNSPLAEDAEVSFMIVCQPLLLLVDSRRICMIAIIRLLFAHQYSDTAWTMLEYIV